MSIRQGREGPSRTDHESFTPEAKRAARGAWIGLFVDYFDIYLPIIALAPAISYFVPSTLSDVTRTTFTYTLFAVTFLGRPIGSFIFGHVADTIGRRRTTLIAAAGITITTFLTGVLPGHALVGVWALVLLVLMRLVGGICMGGEYTGANPLALEQSPKRIRGQVGGFINGAYPFSYIAVSLITLALLSQLPAETSGSAYMTWGWRIPFFVGTLLSFLFFVYFYKQVQESEAWHEENSKRTTRQSPLKELFHGDNLKNFLQVFVLMTGLWFGILVLTSATPTLLITYLHQPSDSVTSGFLAANGVLAIAYPVFGYIGQRYGRRRVLILSGLWTATVTAAAYGLMVYNLAQGGAFVVSIGLVTVCLVLSVAPNAMIVTYICERFATAVRSSGYGIGYSLAVVIPSFHSLMFLALGEVMPYEYTPVVLVVLAGALTALGAAVGPQTNDVDMRAKV